MTQFRMSNGKEGFEKASHTATGYECFANFPDTNKYELRVRLFIRHIVGLDSRPYVEIGMSGLENFEKSAAREAIKKSLKEAKFIEIPSVYGAEKNKNVFSDQDSIEQDSISLIVNSGKDGIVKLTDTLKDLIPEDAKRFILGQEAIEDVLFQSLLYKLGPELNKGPGTFNDTEKKIRQLAAEFQNGL